MKKLIILLTLVSISILLTHTAHPDEVPISVDLSLYGAYMDNVFQTAFPEPDYATLSHLNASYDITSEASLFYAANLSLFSEHSDLRNHTHYLGSDYERDLFQGNGVLYIGGKVGLRQNTPEYELYDHRTGKAYANLKYYFTQTALGKVGYNLEYESHPHYQTYSFLENYGFLRFSKFFQSRTTLQMEMNAGRRSYTNIDVDNSRNYTNQLTGSMKLAQSLGDNTGLQLLYIWHRSSENVIDYQYGDLDYYSIEDFFEDEYSYSNQEYRIVLKHLGAWRTMLKGTVSKQNREYSAESIYTESGKRNDSIFAFSLEAEKKVSLPLNSFPDITFHIQFLHRTNKSNDSYYDYSTNLFSIGTKTAF